MRKTAVAILLAGLFLLMLSALVVTPQDASPPAPPPQPEQYYAVFMPPAEPHAPVSAEVPAQRTQPGTMENLTTAAVDDEWHGTGIHDSNGRVLTAARYENSVYEVFRAEVAGG